MFRLILGMKSLFLSVNRSSGIRSADHLTGNSLFILLSFVVRPKKDSAAVKLPLRFTS